MQRIDLIPQQFRQGAERMAQAFGDLDQVIVAAHVNPDGDAAGAVAAACHVLRSMGKEFMVYAQPGLPAYLDFFPMPGVVHTTLEHPPFKPRCAVLLDCGEPERLGRELAAQLVADGVHLAQPEPVQQPVLLRNNRPPVASPVIRRKRSSITTQLST